MDDIVGRPAISVREMVQIIIQGHKRFAPADCDCDICKGACNDMLEQGPS